MISYITPEFLLALGLGTILISLIFLVINFLLYAFMPISSIPLRLAMNTLFNGFLVIGTLEIICAGSFYIFQQL